MKDLKRVYRAVSKEVAEDELLKLDDKWGKKYPVVMDSWNNNWEELSQYFKYTQPIRKLIYTTNPIEAYHRQIRKVTKTKGAFPNEMRSEEHTSELQSRGHLVCRLLLEKKKKT